MSTLRSPSPLSGPRPPLLHLQDVQRRLTNRGHVHYELNVDMRFDGPDIVGVFGANGAGKSTFMNLIAGKLDPTAGQVRVAGHELNAIQRDERQRLVRHHSQPHLAQPEEGRFQAMVLKPRDWLSATREAFRDLLRAKAPAGAAQVFVFDEPPLEQPYGGFLFDHFVKLRADGGLIFVSVHPHEPWHLREIKSVCNRYVFLEEGRLTVMEGYDEFMAHPGVVDYFSALKFVAQANGREA